jgi:hypothetical protein
MQNTLAYFTAVSVAQFLKGQKTQNEFIEKN